MIEFFRMNNELAKNIRFLVSLDGPVYHDLKFPLFPFFKYYL